MKEVVKEKNFRHNQAGKEILMGSGRVWITYAHPVWRTSYFLYVNCVRVPVRLNPSSWPERNNSFQLNKIPLIGRGKFNQLNQSPWKGGHFCEAPNQARSWSLPIPRGDQAFGQLLEKLLGKQSEEPSPKVKSKVFWIAKGLCTDAVNKETRLSRNETSTRPYTLLETIHIPGSIQGIKLFSGWSSV